MSILSSELYDVLLRFVSDTDTLKACSLANREICPLAQALIFERIQVEYMNEYDFNYGMARFISSSSRIPYNISTFLSSPRHSHLCLYIRQLIIIGNCLQTDVAIQSKQMADMFFPRLTNVRYLRLKNGTVDHILLGTLAHDVFPRITIFSLGNVQGIPSLKMLLGMCPSLCHLQVNVEALAATSMVDQSFERRGEIAPTMLSSLGVTYSGHRNFATVENWQSLQELTRITQQSLKTVVLNPYFQLYISDSSVFLPETIDMLNFCSQITSLHLGPGFWQWTKNRGGESTSSIHFSHFPSLTTLQFEVDEAMSSFSYAESPLFFSWLSNQLASDEKCSSLSSIICKIYVSNASHPSPTCGSTDNLATFEEKLILLLPSLAEFRVCVSLTDPQQRQRLTDYQLLFCQLFPLCEARGFIHVEVWDNPLALVNSAVQR
ncbi:hypothetical protein DL96DRAFT_1274831 [Flagelloscypha sp. PMI_526]|nr:hypothetical protein DL96DRAFT_1274831 [Flagelloscypha sp. PMI_526]